LKKLGQIIYEGKILDRHEGLVHNPSFGQLGSMVDSSMNKELRMIHHPAHGLFAWPAENETHMITAKHLYKKHGFSEFNNGNSWKDNNNYMLGRDKETNKLLMHNTYGSGKADHPVLNRIDQENVPYVYQDRKLR